MYIVTLHFNSRFQHNHQQPPSLQIVTHRILCIRLIIIMMMMMVVTVIPPLLSSFSFILQIKNGKVKSSKINSKLWPDPSILFSQGHVFLEVVHPEEYYPLGLQPSRPSLVPGFQAAVCGPLHDPTLLQESKALQEEQTILRCVSGYSYPARTIRQVHHRWCAKKWQIGGSSS